MSADLRERGKVWDLTPRRSDLYLRVEWRARQNRLCLLRVDVGVGFRLLAGHEDIVDVVESNLVDIDGFASV